MGLNISTFKFSNRNYSLWKICRILDYRNLTWGWLCEILPIAILKTKSYYMFCWTIKPFDIHVRFQCREKSKFLCKLERLSMPQIFFKAFEKLAKKLWNKIAESCWFLKKCKNFSHLFAEFSTIWECDWVTFSKK